MKNIYKTTRIKLIIGMFIILALLTIAVILYKFLVLEKSSTDLSKKATSTTMQEKQAIEKIETQVFASVKDTVQAYILKTYPEATNITLQNEYVGLGYGIINATYTLNNETQKRKVYIADYDSTWTVIHEDENKISCTKVQELISTENVLSSFCE